MSTVTGQLFALQDLEYREFQAKLIPTISKETVIGVRTPALRRLAGQLAGSEEAEEFLKELPHVYYEENNLHGCLIEKIKDYDRCIEALERFLPYVDNWATCDLMAPKILKEHKEELLKEIEKWIASGHTYTIRFGIGMLMKLYLDDNFSAEYVDRVAAVRSEEYYVNMMRAWYIATALAKQYDAVLPYLTGNRLDIWTHNKAIQKAVESYRITPKQKAELKRLKLSPSHSGPGGTKPASE